MIPRNHGGRLAVIGAAIGMLLAAGTATAQSVDRVLEAEKQRVRQNQEAQKRIDNIVQQTNEIVNDYRGVTKEIDGLKIYNRLMEAQTAKQQAKLDEITESMEKANVINRQIFPLMTRMIEGIEKFVALDVPFLLEERTKRIDDLKALMDRPDVTVAEKFRKVMEAYQIESDYGRNIEQYEAAVPVEGGGELTVDFLRIGRVALLYQSSDGSRTGRWDNDARAFVDASEYRNEVREGLDVATQKIAPVLLQVPVAAPGGE
ncbi:MAG: DUF3450 domain-containing protein [Pseudomonadota bacterium]